jgi:hypothetical protein
MTVGKAEVLANKTFIVHASLTIITKNGKIFLKYRPLVSMLYNSTSLILRQKAQVFDLSMFFHASLKLVSRADFIVLMLCMGGYAPSVTCKHLANLQIIIPARHFNLCLP